MIDNSPGLSKGSCQWRVFLRKKDTFNESRTKTNRRHN